MLGTRKRARQKRRILAPEASEGREVFGPHPYTVSLIGDSTVKWGTLKPDLGYIPLKPNRLQYPVRDGVYPPDPALQPMRWGY